MQHFQNKVGSIPVPYVTRKPWGAHQAGSHCLARREGEHGCELVIAFPETPSLFGTEVRVDGNRYYLVGIENLPRSIDLDLAW